MRIFVTGGAGYIGSVCSELLLNEGHEVAIFDNLIEGHRRAVDSRAQFIQGDLADRDQIERALSNTRPDAVMHFAAYALVPESMRDPSKYFRNNVSNGLNLLDAMLTTGVQRIIFSSTCALFGPPDRVPIDETAPARPANPYGESKLAFEKILRWYDQVHGLKFVCLRYFNAAGATEDLGEDHRPETHLIPNVLKVALGQRPSLEIYGTDYETPDGTCIRDYIHIVDLAHAHILALGATASGFYNLGTGGGSSVKEVIAACRKITGRQIDTIEKPRRPGDPPRLIASSEKIKKELGWQPQFQSLDVIIETAWAWHQKFPDGYEE
ncbi:MAG: UDP-glucose 4-epimerase GalE [Verrucomicrobia bacterium 13_2_20CM_55_10]|nr:MAG: UDP-glucose 4-epimerase GalE [Verrucomicrobia bacterium 13_2_20CM_55_10]OLB17887.1 MAG: UDP-glucose 4-epimerase GalE [Verrucomicrobia bacterium 13_2_20CM_2_54_15_9cls]PYI63774.1 MAG: UDP-glucose 4-epimerase GalE [Verrucomicrobiota bacterium]